MPYVTEEEAINAPFLNLEELLGDLPQPPWRAPLVGSPALRVTLLLWVPGYATIPHFHPAAEEIFLVISGRARFTIGDKPEREAGPGELMLAKRGELHAIRVPYGEPLLLLAAVAPNADRPDETIEPA